MLIFKARLISWSSFRSKQHTKNTDKNTWTNISRRGIHIANNITRYSVLLVIWKVCIKIEIRSYIWLATIKKSRDFKHWISYTCWYISTFINPLDGHITFFPLVIWLPFYSYRPERNFSACSSGYMYQTTCRKEVYNVEILETIHNHLLILKYTKRLWYIQIMEYYAPVNIKE